MPLRHIRLHDLCYPEVRISVHITLFLLKDGLASVHHWKEIPLLIQVRMQISVPTCSSVILLNSFFFKSYSNMRRYIILSEKQAILNISLLVNLSSIRFSSNCFGIWNLFVFYYFGGEKLPNVDHSMHNFIIKLRSFNPSFSKSSVVNLHTIPGIISSS